MAAQQQAAFLNMMRVVMTVSMYAPVFFLIYPTAVLVVMFLPSVRAAFREGPPPPPAEVVPDQTDRFEARER